MADHRTQDATGPADALYERETILRFDEGDPVLYLYTFRRGMAARLLKAGAELKAEGRRKGKVVSWTLELPKKWFREPRPRRTRTAAQKAASAAALEARSAASKPRPAGVLRP